MRHHRVREALDRALAAQLPSLSVVSLYGVQRETALREFSAGRGHVAICMVESCGVPIDLSRASLCNFC